MPQPHEADTFPATPVLGKESSKDSVSGHPSSRKGEGFFSVSVYAEHEPKVCVARPSRGPKFGDREALDSLADTFKQEAA